VGDFFLFLPVTFAYYIPVKHRNIVSNKWLPVGKSPAEAPRNKTGILKIEII